MMQALGIIYKFDSIETLLLTFQTNIIPDR